MPIVLIVLAGIVGELLLAVCVGKLLGRSGQATYLLVEATNWTPDAPAPTVLPADLPAAQDVTVGSLDAFHGDGVALA